VTELSPTILPILAMFVVACALATAMLTLSYFLGPKKKNYAKSLPYECGIDPLRTTRSRISVKYYLVAIMFLLFDLEAAFLFPFAFSWQKMVSTVGAPSLSYLLFFFVFFLVGIFYDLKSGALEWET